MGRYVIAQKAHGGVGNIAKNQNIGVIEGQGEISPDDRNLGLAIKHELAKR